MNLTLFGAIALIAFVGDSSCGMGIGMGPGFGNFAPMVGGPFGPGAVPFGPGAGWMLGQEAQKAAANTVVENAVLRAGSTELSPEFQEELQMILAETQLAIEACDDFLLTSVWRYKVCKFQAVSQLRLRIQELKLKAAAAAALAATTPAPQAFQPAEPAADASDA